MSKRLLGIIILIISTIAYYFLTTEFETTALCQTILENKILSDPKIAAGNYFILAGNKAKNLYKFNLIDSKGQILSESQNLPHTPFEPIVIGNNIIAADRGKVLRGFSLPDFKVLWERGSNTPFELGPLPCGESNVIQASDKSIYCFDSKTGKQLWDITLTDGIKNYACDKVIINIHGYKDIEKPIWKCSAYDLEYGDKIWELEEPVSKDTPIFVKDTCILTTASGEAIVVNQLSGNILFRSETKDYTVIKALDEGVLLANKSYTTFAYLSLITGKSWTSSIKKDFVGAVQIGSRLIFADKISLRCFNLDTGVLIWQKDLGDIYDCSPHREGFFVTYKDDFTSRTTYGACLGADSTNSLWLAKGSSIFRKPCPLADGDLVLNYDGTIRVMPKPVFNTSSISQNTNSPTATATTTIKDNKKIEEKPSKDILNTNNQQNNSNTNQAIPSVLPTVSDEEAGW